jgi:hypothetical protein
MKAQVLTIPLLSPPRAKTALKNPMAAAFFLYSTYLTKSDSITPATASLSYFAKKTYRNNAKLAKTAVKI